MSRRNLIITFATAWILLAGTVRSADAQLGWTFVGVGDFDTQETVLVLGGVSVSPRGQGWSWVAGVTAYWLQFETGGVTGDDKRSITSITPSAGVKNNFGSGSAQVRVGYSFKDGDDDGGPGFIESAGDGVVTIGQLDYWGTGAWNAQAIGSYNWGSEALWARGRLARRLFTVGDAGSVSLGAEAAILNQAVFDATRVGGLVMFNPGRGTLINAAVGRMLADGEDNDATYFTFELVLYPR
ncbi:MAG: hypothetical protein ACT4O1_12855 [Gemmatimonadota bacterium]